MLTEIYIEALPLEFGATTDPNADCNQRAVTWRWISNGRMMIRLWRSLNFL